MTMRLRGPRRISESAPFDVPCDDGVLGVRADGGTLVTVLGVRPGPPVPVRATPGWDRSGPHAPADHALPLNCLAQWIIRPEADATTITVLTHGTSCWGDGRPARAYRSLLGPLSVAAHRAVYVVVRFEPMRCPSAVARHGAGPAAALAACLSANRRILALMRGHGVPATPLTAAQITDVAGRLTEGVEPSSATAEPDLLRTGRVVCTTSAIDAPNAARTEELLESAWLPDALSATWALTLHPRPGGTRVSALVRGNAFADTPPPQRPGLTTLTGLQRDAAAATLPVAFPAGFTPPMLVPAAARDLLAHGRLPIAGAGQLIGADADGVPVTLPMAGPQVPRSAVSGDFEFVAQTVTRLVALGVSASIDTGRPERWASLIDAVGDPAALTFSGVGAQVVVDDRAGRWEEANGPGTVLRVCEDSPDDESDDRPTLRQDPHDPAYATARAGGRTIRVRLVSTPAETALTRAASPALR
ncbi:MAG: type VII secretion protein EccE [Gordonia sp. (in: high G+C Gram-positive bacteria)]